MLNYPFGVLAMCEAGAKHLARITSNLPQELSGLYYYPVFQTISRIRQDINIINNTKPK